MYSDEPGGAEGGETRREEGGQTEEEERELSKTAGDVQLSRRLDYSLKSALGEREARGRKKKSGEKEK